MASKSEKTNAKNLENLHIANETIETVPNYNPSNKLIQKAELTTFESNFAAGLQTVNAEFAAEQAAVAAQTAAFKQIPARVTQIMNAARGQNLAPEKLEQLMTTVRRLRGVRVSDKTPDNPATPDVDESQSNRSVSRRSIAGILESLDLLDEQIKTDANYNPNEVELKTAAITAWIDSLRALHNAVLTRRAATTGSRQARDSYGYNRTDGLIARMNQMKNYAESILDKTDARLKKLKSLKFVDPTIK